MTATDLSIFLLTTFDAEGKETQRLVKAETRLKASHHALRTNLASADDVARVLGAGGKVEEAQS